MPKKVSSKPSTPMPEDSLAKEEKKPSSTPKKPGNEIDEIFAGKKRKKSEQGKAKKPAKDAAGKPDNMEKTRKKSKGHKESGSVEPPSRPRKRMSGGLTIYTEEELGIGRVDGGGTPLCPFDCSCCF